MNEFIKSGLNAIFKRSPDIDLFEYVWMPEIKREGMCIGYFWYSDEQKLIYAIAEKKYGTKHYIESQYFRLTGFYNEDYRCDYQPIYNLFQLVRIEATSHIHMICGLEYNNQPAGWVYHVDRVHTPYCTDELQAFSV